MPSYNLRCSDCGASKTRRFDVPQKFPVDTCACGGPMRRVPRPPTTTVKESLDNGAMTKRVERFKDAERLYRDRAANDPDKK